MVNKFKEQNIKAPSPEQSSEHPYGEITIGEQETELIQIKSESDQEILKYVLKGGASYPHVRVPTDIDPRTFARPRTRQLLKTKDNNDKQRVVPDEQARNSKQTEKGLLLSLYLSVLHYFQILAYYIPCLQFFFSVRLPFYVYPMHSKKDHMIVAFDWHPNLMRFACALQDNGIYFYDLKNEEWTVQVLRHDFHRKICSIKWRPNYPNMIAVACQYGVCLWDLNKRIVFTTSGNTSSTSSSLSDTSASLTSRTNIGRSIEQNGVCIFLRIPDFGDLSSMAWSPDGDMLVVGSRTDHRIAVWQPIKGKDQLEWSYRALTRFNGSIKSLSFSPNGRFLSVFTNTSVFRIWDTITWKCEKWNTSGWIPISKNLDPSVRCHQWSHNSQYLLISLENQESIHVLKFSKDPPQISGEYSFEIDLSKYEYNFSPISSSDNITQGNKSSPTSNKPNNLSKKVTLCGTIDSFVLDNGGYGERLAVSFVSSTYVALLQCDFESLVTHNPFLPIGYIRGGITSENGASKPVHLGFWPSFKKGALLSVSWGSGQISFYPLYYANNDGWETLENVSQHNLMLS